MASTESAGFDAAGRLVADRYRIVRILGSGSSGQTFLATDEADGRSVALKLLGREADLKARELFEREGIALGALRHSAIPAVYQAGRADWDGRLVPFLAMEYIEGTSLLEVIAAGAPVDRAEVIGLMADLLGILDYLHGRLPPVLHRDIKPANVIRRPGGGVALVDFGSVRTRHHGPEDAGSTVAGTWGYMPYEQYMGQASAASDLFALGATILHLVTGRAPGSHMSPSGQIEVGPDLPGGEPLRSVLARLLRPVPEERFQSAREARAALFGAVPDLPAVRVGYGTDVAVRGPSPAVAALAATLTKGPRPRDRNLKALERRLAGSTLELMDGSVAPSPGFDIASLALVSFFSVMTIGILPAVFLSLSFGRRRRIRPFLIAGVPAVGRILEKESVDVGFGEKLIKIDYEFEADGTLHRGSDRVMPWVADRWRVGDTIQILYLAARDHDSIILSTS